MFRIHRSGRYLDFKPAKGLQTFVPPSEFLGRLMADVLPSDVAEPAQRFIERAIDTGELQVFHYQLSLPDGLHEFEARIVALDEEEVLATIREVAVAADPPMTNGYGLTARELSVLRLAAQGLTDRQIALELEIKPMTAHKHIANILRKMIASSRTEASVRALQDGLLS